MRGIAERGTCNNNYTKAASCSRLHRDQTLALSSYPGEALLLADCQSVGKNTSGYVGIQTTPFKLSAITASTRTRRHNMMSCCFASNVTSFASRFGRIHRRILLEHVTATLGTKLKAQLIFFFIISTEECCIHLAN